MTAIMPVSEAKDAEITEILNRAGRFLQNFALLEVITAAWLISLESTPDLARKFLNDKRNLATRIKRLSDLLGADATAESVSLASDLAEIEPLRRFRNHLVNSPVGAAPDGATRMIGWASTVDVSSEIVVSHNVATLKIVHRLHTAHVARFGHPPSLQIAAPPPTE